MRIAVAGATGVVGRHVVDEVRRAGHDPVPMARALGVDVVTGEGLAEALRGVDVVIDVLSTNVDDGRQGDRLLRDDVDQPVAGGAGGRRTPSRGAVDRGHRPGPEWLLPGQAAAGRGGRGGSGAVDDPAGHPVPRVRSAAAGRRPGPADRPRSEHAQPADRGGGGGRGTRGTRHQTIRQGVRRTSPAPSHDRWSRWRAPSPMPRSDASWSSRCTSRERRAGRCAKARLLPDTDGPRGRETFEEWLARTT